MTRYRRCFAVVCATLAIVTPLATAKRVSPKPVPPVVADGVQYSAEGDGKNQDVVATDVSSGKQLWKVRVVHTPIKSSVEEEALPPAYQLLGRRRCAMGFRHRPQTH